MGGGAGMVSVVVRRRPIFRGQLELAALYLLLEVCRLLGVPAYWDEFSETIYIDSPPFSPPFGEER